MIALNVPDKAYILDNFVNDVSQKTLKSVIAFILLHELGHIHFRHRSYGEISAEQAQESESDRFAMRVLRRMRLPPMGMPIWFSSTNTSFNVESLARHCSETANMTNRSLTWQI